MKKLSLFLILFIVLASVVPTYAATSEPELVARTAILIDENTGKMLYGKGEKARMYPASMTKTLTALVAVDYLKAGDLITAGNEVNAVPWDASIVGTKRGETMEFVNLLRALMIRSGSETACVLAEAVAKKETGLSDMSYTEAERIFAGLMNEKAESLGCEDSYFINPHGLHDDNHYTTAYDMALITRAAMQNDLIRKICAEREYQGNGAGLSEEEKATTSLQTQDYDWVTRDEMLLPTSDYYYPYATGVKTGSTDEAGDCFAAAAEKDGKKMISVVMFSTEEGRWLDTIKLMDYGFDTFNDETIQKAGDVLDNMYFANALLGEVSNTNVMAKEDVVEFLSKDELAAVKREITYKTELIASVEEADEGRKDNETLPKDGTLLKAPITAGAEIGTVQYTLDGETLYEGAITAAGSITERTAKSDREYYYQKAMDKIFSLEALPFWGAGVAVLAVIIGVTVAVKKRSSRRNRYNYRGPRRRY